MSNLWKTIVRFTSWIFLVFGVMFFPFVEFLGAQETPPQAVRIGVLAKRGPQRALEKWEPTAKYLNERISNYSFSILPLSYDQIYSAVEKEDVEFILANSSFYVGLEMLYGASRILTLKNIHFGKGYKVYGGVIFTRADRKDIRYYSDLKGKTFMTLDEQAFASWPAVWFELKEHGVDPYTDFTSLKFRSPMDAVVLAVRDGEVDAGSIRTDLLERMAMEGSIRLEDFHVLGIKEHKEDIELVPLLHSTPSYPEWPLAKTKNTPDVLAEKVANALLQMTPDSEAAKAARITGWTIPLNYQPVHEVLKKLRIGPYKDYGKVSPMEIVRQYWPWFLGIIVILSSFLTAYLMKINQRLQLAVVDQKNEITMRKKAEKEQRESEENIRLLLESTVEGIYGLDLDGNCTFANPSCAKILGYDEANQLMGKNMHDLIHHTRNDGTPYPMEECKIYQAFREGKTTSVDDEVFWRADGTSFPAEYWSHPMWKDGKTIGTVVTFVDITGRKKAEEELNALNVELIDKNEELEQLIYVASHDLRSPLVNVQGFTTEIGELAKELGLVLSKKEISPKVINKIAPILEKELPHSLNRVLLNVEKMDALLNGLLRLSRVGRAELNIIELDMSKLVSNIIEANKHQIQDKEAEVETGNLPSCFGDESQIDQVFSNLLDNALKYLNPERKGFIKISGERKGEEAVYCVEDNGIGIHEDHHNIVFELFHRLDPKKSEGEGLGLTIISRILNKHGGKVWVESKQDGGSKFFVSLPTIKSLKRRE